jgi:hypothetical protein
MERGVSTLILPGIGNEQIQVWFEGMPGYGTKNPAEMQQYLVV